MNKEIDNFVDLLFNFDIKELKNETTFLENYKKLQQENEQLKAIEKEHQRINGELREENKDLQQKTDKAIEYIKIYRSYENIDGKDYLKNRDEIGSLGLLQVDKLLEILGGKE